MKVVEFGCPSCRARLRLRADQPLRDAFDCPDCGVKLTAAPNADGTLEATAVVLSSSQTLDPASGRSRWSGFARLVHRYPGRTAWVLVGGLALGIVSWIVWPANEIAVDVDDDVVVDEPHTTADENATHAADDLSQTEMTGDQQHQVAARAAARPSAGSVAEAAASSSAGNASVGHRDLDNPVPESSVELPEENGLARTLDLLGHALHTAGDVQREAELPAGDASDGDLENDALPQEDQAISVKIEPPKSLEEFQSALKMRLLEYRQTHPVALHQQFTELEELLDVRFVLDESLQQRSTDWLDQPITIAMDGCTVDEILQQVLKEADLRSEFRDGRLYLIPRSADSAVGNARGD